MIRVAVCLVLSCAVAPAGTCPEFRDSLNTPGAIGDAGGTVSGAITFVNAVNKDGVQFHGAARIRYADPVFNASRGTVAFWIAKPSAETFGGVLQIGLLGTPNSLGVFYNDQTDLYFEIRSAANEWGAAVANNALSSVDFLHVAITWENFGSEVGAKLFLNGKFASYFAVPGSLSPSSGTLELGVAGNAPWYGFGEVVLDEVTFSSHPFSDSEVYGEYVYSSNRFRRQATSKPPSTGPVRIVNGALRVHGEPFLVKGVGYQPMPVGAGITRVNLDAVYTDPCVLARDLPLLRSIGVNTVRFWSELPDSNLLLDALYNNGVHPIYAVMGFWVPMAPGDDYSDPVFGNNLEQSFRTYVQRFKDHPAVLAWGIGNENNLSYGGDLSDWYTLGNRLAAAAYDTEGATYHPAMIINGGLWDFGDVDVGSDDVSLGFVDLWGHNTYFGYEDHCYYDYYDRLSAKPLLLTEYGVDAYDINASAEYPITHAQWVVHQWQQIRVRSLGGTVMAYSDEWWKAGSPNTHDTGGFYSGRQPDGYSNEEWWGLVSVASLPSGCDEVTPRLAFFALGDEFAKDGGDFDGDGDVDTADWAVFETCFTGPDAGPLTYLCDPGDMDRDRDIDCTDYVLLTRAWTGPGSPTALAACAAVIPAASTWGLTVFALLLLVAGTIRVRGALGACHDQSGV